MKMVSVGWPRVRCCSGLRYLVLLVVIVLALGATLTIRPKIFVWDTWSWGCGAEEKLTPGPEAIIQLRRQVAGKLINIATHLQSSMAVGEAPAIELEVMAALLDPRFAPLFPRPVPPEKSWVPEPLSHLQNNVSTYSEIQQPEKSNITKEEYGQVDTTYPENKITNGSTSSYSDMTDESENLIEKYDSYPEIPVVSSSYSSSVKDSNNNDKQSKSWSANDPVEYNQGRSKGNAGKTSPDHNKQSKSWSEDDPVEYNTNARPSVNGDTQEDLINTIPLEEQVTVIIDGCDTYPGIIRQVTRQARALWPEVFILVAVDSRKTNFEVGVSSDYKVSVYTMSCEWWRRTDLRALATYIATPYVLVLEGIIAVTPDINIHRLISVAQTLAHKGVSIIGGAERGSDGTWDYKCTQLDIYNTRLKLNDGYEYSQEACLFCDVVSSSFLAETKVLYDIPYDSNLPKNAQALDWSLRLLKQGVLSMTCPDVMFHVSRSLRVQDQNQDQEQHSCITKQEKKEARAKLWIVKRQYRKLAQKWELNYINFSNGTQIEYNCYEIHFDCGALSRVGRNILPPCCMKIKNKMLNVVDLISKEHRIPYEISCGTLLGALKFRDGLPWDFDEDAYYRNLDVFIFMKNKQRMRRLGLSPAFSVEKSKFDPTLKSQYIYINAYGGFLMDLWGLKDLPSKGNEENLSPLPDNIVCFQHGHIAMPATLALSIHRNMSDYMKRTHPTPCYLLSLVRVGINWVPAPWNPGRAAIVKYGENLFRHEPHWRYSGADYTKWPNCSEVGYHTCLDLHPLDGSLSFI